jgi:predicted RecA/RadA family phage recombinase
MFHAIQMVIANHGMLGGVLIAAFMALCSAPFVFGNVNQIYSGTPSSRRQVLFPTTITSGQAILTGKEPCVTLDSYQANIGGATCEFNGTFALSVTAKSSLSPSTGVALKPGDALYADGGTVDATTNVTYGFTIDANSAGVPFGYVDPTGPGLASGLTGVINVVVGRL